MSLSSDTAVIPEREPPALARAPAAAYVTELINPLDLPDWDEQVLAHPNHCFFHGRLWAEVLHRTYGFQPAYLISMTGSRTLTETPVRALLPVMEIKSRLRRPRGVSLPFSDFCPPLLSGTDDFATLFRAGVELGKRRGWRYLECRGGWEEAGGPQASTRYYAHRLDLSPGVDRLFAGLKSEVRTAIRKAGRQQVQVERSLSLEAVETFYRLHCKTRQRHGLPPQPFAFFRNIQRVIFAAGHGSVFLARCQDAPVAAAIFFHLGKRAVYKFGASDGARQNLRANDLVMWEAIRWYANHQFESLHFGRTSLDQEGLRRFKLSFGTTEENLAYFRYDLVQDKFVSVKDRAHGWHTTVFRLLPRSLSRMIGNMLYRHMS